MPLTKLPSQKLRQYVRLAVREELQDLLDDPDLGLQVRPVILKRLERSRRSVERGRVISSEDLIAHLNLRV